MKQKTTRTVFCATYPQMAKLRRTDPIQFQVLYNDWKRTRETRSDNLQNTGK